MALTVNEYIQKCEINKEFDVLLRDGLYRVRMSYPPSENPPTLDSYPLTDSTQMPLQLVPAIKGAVDSPVYVCTIHNTYLLLSELLESYE